MLNTLLLLIIANYFLACSVLATPVHFILPNGYSGIFKIVLDEANGIEVKKNDGRYIIEIPADGQLKVKSFALFRKPHEETASFSDGSQIKLDDGLVTDDTVALRSLGEYEKGDGPNTILMGRVTKTQLDYVANQMSDDPNFDTFQYKLLTKDSSRLNRNEMVKS